MKKIKLWQIITCLCVVFCLTTAVTACCFDDYVDGAGQNGPILNIFDTNQTTSEGETIYYVGTENGKMHFQTTVNGQTVHFYTDTDGEGFMDVNGNYLQSLGTVPGGYSNYVLGHDANKMEVTVAEPQICEDFKSEFPRFFGK